MDSATAPRAALRVCRAEVPRPRVLDNVDVEFERVEVPTFDPVALFDALFEGGFDADYNVFWNVRFDFAALIKPWAVERAPAWKANHLASIKLRKEMAALDAKILVEREVDTGDRIRRRDAKREVEELEGVEHFVVGPYRILYIPKKGFRLTRNKRKRGRRSVTFFDAMQFYATGIGEAASLDRTARQHLGHGKTDVELGVDREQIGSDVGYYEAHRDAVVRYCRDDAEKTAALFVLTVESFERIGVAFPKEPWSRASVGREYLKRTGVLEPTKNAYRTLSTSGKRHLWERAYAGACILMRGVGAWPDVVRFDSNSAYPYAMADFPSLEGAYLVDRSDARFDACYFKFYEVELTPTPRRALPARDGVEDRLLYVHGGKPRRAFVTQIDLDLFDAYGDAYRIVDAVGVVTRSDERPLAYMETLYRRKDKIREEFGRDSVEYQNTKIMLNGTYGILTQSRPRAGRYTNFIYGAYITAHTRRALWMKAAECERKGGTVLSYMTDGLFVADLADPPKASTAFGEWDVEDVGLVVLFANGLYVAGGKLKKRGAPDLTLDALMASDARSVTTTKARPFGLKQGIIQAHPERIGVFLDETKELTPADMLEGAGLVVPKALHRASLRDYFTRRWFLDYRAAVDAPSPVPRRRIPSASPTEGSSREGRLPSPRSDP